MIFYKTKTCKECGKKFTPKLPSQKYCCSECSYTGRKKAQKEYWDNIITIDGVRYTRRKPRDYTRMNNINKFAREHGITYGTAVAVLSGKIKINGVSV